MGYSHSWTISSNAKWREVLPLIVEDARRIVQAAGIPVCHDYDCNDEEPALLDQKKGIYLAGQEESCEPLVMHPGDAGYMYCKTQRRPYDIVVGAVILRARIRGGDSITIRSDGRWDDKQEWGLIRLLVKRLWPNEDEIVECPFERDSDGEDES